MHLCHLASFGPNFYPLWLAPPGRRPGAVASGAERGAQGPRSAPDCLISEVASIAFVSDFRGDAAAFVSDFRSDAAAFVSDFRGCVDVLWVLPSYWHYDGIKKQLPLLLNKQLPLLQ